MKKSKKILYISLLVIDVAVTLFLFVLSIIMLINMPDREGIKAIQANGPKNMLEWFYVNPTAYFFIGVLPLILLLVANVIILILYVRKTNEKKKLALNDLSDAEKEALKAELLKDLKGPEENK